MEEEEGLIGLTAEIVANYVANNRVSTSDVAAVIQQVHGALTGLGQTAAAVAEAKVPVVSVRSSIKPDYLVCMECGGKHKMLKRHIMTAHQMTPAQYRADYGLSSSYPMVAPNYSETRRSLAVASGLGRKPGQKSGSGNEAGAGGKKRGGVARRRPKAPGPG
jgi:predicted transcriptional regulator